MTNDNTSSIALHLVAFALVALVLIAGVCRFADAVSEVGSCGVGPAAPRDCSPSSLTTR